MKRLLLATALIAVTGFAQAKVTELQVFRDRDFRGQSDTIKGEVANLEHGLGREVSSVIAKGGAWEVCTEDHFKGRCRVLPEGEYRTLGKLNDRIMSVRFLGDDPRFNRRRDRVAERDWEEWRDYRDARREWDNEARYEVDRVRPYR